MKYVRAYSAKFYCLQLSLNYSCLLQGIYTFSLAYAYSSVLYSLSYINRFAPA